MEIFNKICKTKVGKLIATVMEESILSIEDVDLLQKIIDEKRKTAVEEVLCECLPGQCNCHQHNLEKDFCCVG